MNQKRLFLGFSVSNHIAHNLLHTVKPQIIDIDSCLKWTMDNDFYITSCFIGKIDELRTLKLRDLFHKIEWPTMPIYYEIGCVAPFPQHNSHLLAAIIKPNDHLNQVREQCNKIVSSLGLSVEKRAYKPHITLARGLDSNSHLNFPINQSYLADRFTLYESKINSACSKYEELESHFLG